MIIGHWLEPRQNPVCLLSVSADTGNPSKGIGPARLLFRMYYHFSVDESLLLK